MFQAIFKYRIRGKELLKVFRIIRNNKVAFFSLKYLNPLKIIKIIRKLLI